MKNIKLKMKFEGDKVSCAKSPCMCRNCSKKNECEYVSIYYDPYEGIEECMKHRKYKRKKGGSIKQVR